MQVFIAPIASKNSWIEVAQYIAQTNAGSDMKLPISCQHYTVCVYMYMNMYKTHVYLVFL